MSADHHVASFIDAQVIGTFVAVSAQYRCLDSGAVTVDFQNENVVTALALIVDARSAESGTAKKRKVRTAGIAGDVEVAVRALLHRVGVVVVITADVGLPYPCACLANVDGFEVFAYDHFQVTIR